MCLQACAPLYHWRTVKVSSEMDPVGTCYVAVQNFSAYAEYSPCRTSEYTQTHIFRTRSLTDAIFSASYTVS